LRDAGPALNAVMHGDVLFESQDAKIIQGQLDWILNQAGNLELVSLEAIRNELLPILTHRHLSVWPEAGRDVLGSVVLTRDELVEGEQHDGVSDGFLRVLKPTGEEPGDVVCSDPKQQHDSDPDEPQDHAGRPKIIGSEHDVVHIALKAGQRNKGDMDHNEADEPDENQEVD